MSANTKPLYPGAIKKPRAFLDDTVTPRKITTQTPVLLYNGSSNNYGAVITNILVQHNGDNIASVLRLYSRLASSVVYDLMLEHSLTAVTSSNNTSAIAYEEITLPAMHPGNGWPDNRGFRLEPKESLYVALGTAIASGITIFAEVQEY